jgi:hypothetical protein
MKFKFKILLIFLLLIVASDIYSQKIDTIYHINGNILTGDFKRMNYGVVSWSMDGMGTISLEEPKIRTIKSSKQFEIKLKDGLLYFGSFDTSGINHHVYIVLTNGRELVNINRIVEVYPIRKNFWRRTSGNFSLGLNYSLGSSILTTVFAGNLDYKKRKAKYYFNWDNNNTWLWKKGEDSLTASRFDLSLGWAHTFRKGWSAGVEVGASQNLELGTKLRLNLTPLLIRDILYNNWNRIWAGAGVSFQREMPYDETLPVTDDFVGIVSLAWKVYKYTNPKIWVDANVTFIPYFTNRERYRTNINLNPKIGLIGNDLKVGFRFYVSLDSSPPSETSTGVDYGINFEVTYSLH